MTATEALEADLRAWNNPSGVLVHAARQIAAAIDSGPTDQDLTRLSIELRQLIKAIREANPVATTTDLDRFLDVVRATEFDH